MFTRSLLASIIGMTVVAGASTAALAHSAPMAHRIHVSEFHRADHVEVVRDRVVRTHQSRTAKTRVVVRRHHGKGLAKISFAHRTAPIAHRIG